MNDLRRILGAALSSLAGAAVGVLVPGDGGPAHISLICLTAFCGWLFWVRRSCSVVATFGVCLALLIVWWPLALMLREATRDRF